MKPALGVSLLIAWIGFVLICDQSVARIVYALLAGWQIGGWAGHLICAPMRERTERLRRDGWL